MTPIDPRHRPAEPKSFTSWSDRAARHHQGLVGRAESRSPERPATPQAPVF